MVAAADTSLYDWMMIISVVLGYIDQVTDLMFVSASRSTSVVTSAFAGGFIIFFLLVRTGMAVAQGRGLLGALLALTGTELAVRAWQAYRSDNQDAIARWKEVAEYISVESVLEGVPLIVLAIIYIYQLGHLCQFVTCDATTIARTFPSHVLTLPEAPSISAAAVQAIHSHDRNCAHLPLTDDGWFTSDLDFLNATYVDREPGPFEQVIEFEIAGSAMERITGAPSPSFACVGGNARHPDTWTSLSLSTSSLIPSLSIICGILCSAYHLSRKYSTDEATSLWALPDAPSKRDHDSRQGSHPAAAIAGSSRRPSLFGAQVHPDGGAPQRSRPSMHAIRSALSARPELGPVVVHYAAAFACFAVDIAFIVCLWVEVVHTGVLAVPHVALLPVNPVVLMVAAGVKAWLVVGRFGRPWLAAVGQMMWTVTPLRVTNPWMLRVAPRWGRYAAVTVSIAVNGVLLAWATAIPAAVARGGGYPWRIVWRTALVLWVLYGMHMALVRLAFWTHKRALAAPAEGSEEAAVRKIDAMDTADVEQAAMGKCGTGVVGFQGSVEPPGCIVGVDSDGPGAAEI